MAGYGRMLFNAKSRSLRSVMIFDNLTRKRD